MVIGVYAGVGKRKNLCLGLPEEYHLRPNRSASLAKARSYNRPTEPDDKSRSPPWRIADWPYPDGRSPNGLSPRRCARHRDKKAADKDPRAPEDEPRRRPMVHHWPGGPCRAAGKGHPPEA